MKVNVDLHSHSSYSPSVFGVSLEKLAYSMSLKGIDVLGTGDCLFPKWVKELKSKLTETEKGIFGFQEITQNEKHKIFPWIKNARFLLQTELIFTFSKEKEKHRKRMDVVFLFPSFRSAEKAIELLTRWKVKNTTGRPFIVCSKLKEVEEKIKRLLEIDPWIEAIPAHIMTPEGIYGSHNNINSFSEVFKNVRQIFHAVETGLSADVEILSLIPELDPFTLISSSDLHSSSFGAVGRESTILEIQHLNYRGIISAIRENKVACTIEFPPAEGKYFLTGHRGDRAGHDGKFCYYSPACSPKSGFCPICGKKLNIGVFERAFQLRELQGGKRKFGELKPNAKPLLRVVSLIEVLKLKGVGEKEYLAICQEFGNELKFWEASLKEAEEKLSGLKLNPELIKGILKVKQGRFCFNPPGYDGIFGTLQIDEEIDLMNIRVGPEKKQSMLF